MGKSYSYPPLFTGLVLLGLMGQMALFVSQRGHFWKKVPGEGNY